MKRCLYDYCTGHPLGCSTMSDEMNLLLKKDFPTRVLLFRQYMKNELVQQPEVESKLDIVNLTIGYATYFTSISFFFP